MAGMLADIRIPLDPEQIADVCRRHRIRRMSLYGSVIRDDFTALSDVDVLVELDPDYHPGLEYFGITVELEALFGRRVDVVRPTELSRYFKAEVLREAIPVYVAS